MFSFDPLVAAKKAVALVRKGVDLPLGFDNPMDDVARETILEGLPLWVAQAHGHLYLISNDSWPGIYKIGCTRKTVPERIEALNGEGLLTPWTVQTTWAVYDAHGLEAQAHRRLAALAVKGELFSGPVAHLKTTVAQVIQADRASLDQGLAGVLGGYFSEIYGYAGY